MADRPEHGAARGAVPVSGADRRAVVMVLLAGLFTVGVTITALSNSLDTIADDLGTSRSTMLWTITGPMLAFGIVGPAFGKAGDIVGHRRVYVLGLLGAGVFAAATALAWSPASLITFRVLSATSGSAAGPAALAYVNRLYAPEERVRPLGWWSFVNAGSPVLGVVIGAPLIEAFGWRVLFAIQAPLCVLGALVALRLLPDTARAARVRFDLPGAVALAVGAASLLIAVTRGAVLGWGSTPVLGGFALSVVAMVCFVQIERRAAEPIVPLEWLRRRNVVAPIASQSFSNFAYMGSFILAPALLQNALGYDESSSGLVLIARPVSFAIAAPFGSIVTMRIGERRSAVIGASAITVSMIVFASIDGAAGARVIAALALAGFGLGIAAPALVSTVANAVEETALGVAGALQQLSGQLSAVLGASVLQSVQASTDGTFESFRRSFLVAAVVSTGGIVSASFVRPTSRQRPPRRRTAGTAVSR